MNRELLRKHFEQMPLMQPVDALKLVFQHAFGCTHMSPYLPASMKGLELELERTKLSDGVPVSTPIGGGLCRLNLANPRVHALGAERIARMMQASVFHVLHREDVGFPGPGNELRYYGSLTDVLAMIQEGRTAFTRAQWEELLEWHRNEGRPAVGHSDLFRSAYDPHYRVVLEDCAVLLPVMEQVQAGRNAIVLDGPCGSGKSTLAQILREVLGAAPIPMDDFFLPFEMRTEERLSQPGGNVHHERFRAEVLDRVKVGESLTYQRFDCQTGTLKETKIDAKWMNSVLIEGSYSHHPAFSEVYERLNALRVYVDVDADEQLRRIALRSPDLLEMFQTRWIPLEKKYFEAYDIKDRADLAVKTQPWDED